MQGSEQQASVEVGSPQGAEGPDEEGESSLWEWGEGVGEGGQRGPLSGCFPRSGGRQGAQEPSRQPAPKSP